MRLARLGARVLVDLERDERFAIAFVRLLAPIPAVDRFGFDEFLEERPRLGVIAQADVHIGQVEVESGVDVRVLLRPGHEGSELLEVARAERRPVPVRPEPVPVPRPGMIVADQPVHDRDLRDGSVEQVGDDRVPFFELRQHIGFVGRRDAEDIRALCRPGRRPRLRGAGRRLSGEHGATGSQCHDTGGEAGANQFVHHRFAPVWYTHQRSFFWRRSRSSLCRSDLSLGQLPERQASRCIVEFLLAYSKIRRPQFLGSSCNSATSSATMPVAWLFQ